MEKEINRNQENMEANQIKIERREAIAKQERVIDDVFNREITLITAYELANLLKLDQGEFSKWRKQKYSLADLLIGRATISLNKLHTTLVDAENKFPTPVLYVGGDPRWSVEEVKKWLLKCSIKNGLD